MFCVRQVPVSQAIGLHLCIIGTGHGKPVCICLFKYSRSSCVYMLEFGVCLTHTSVHDGPNCAISVLYKLNMSERSACISSSKNKKQKKQKMNEHTKVYGLPPRCSGFYKSRQACIYKWGKQLYFV